METLKIDGMHCGNCTAAVTKALEAIDGISAVYVDLEKKEASFENNGIAKEKLKAAIQAIGFDVVD